MEKGLHSLGFQKPSGVGGMGGERLALNFPPKVGHAYVLESPIISKLTNELGVKNSYNY